VNVGIILGTRPEIIKLSPVIREIQKKRNFEYFILHTGQHYSFSLDGVFFEQLSLPRPKYNLGVGSGTHAETTGKMLIGIEKILLQERPDIVLVEGDTNSVLAGALAACKIMIKVGHIEAGLRSYDREMPEEINRILTDHISDYLFAPTLETRQILINEGIDANKITVTGNTIVDAIAENIQLAERAELPPGVVAKSIYFLATIHRQENVDNHEKLKKIMLGLDLVAKELEAEIILPIHPRTRKRLETFGISLPSSIKLIDPLDYLTFLKLMKGARMILTDSGGVQEEACILKIPCVTLRYNTDRPETISVGANVLAGVEPLEILEKARQMIKRKKDWTNPLGDGTASERIVAIVAAISK
jgi:UDP-N-acetylglucosamine 2-epimerase (non-hydrolysing)